LSSERIDPNLAETLHGGTPLIVASQRGFTAIALALMQDPRVTNATSHSGTTALDAAKMGATVDVSGMMNPQYLLQLFTKGFAEAPASMKGNQVGCLGCIKLLIPWMDGEDMSKVCRSCFKLQSSKMCSACNRACYCSVECQKRDWKVHKTMCCKV